MRITKLTPDQARTAGQLLQRALDWIRRFREQFRQLALRLLEKVRATARHLRRLEPERPLPRRPAWASPYGPPPKQA